MTMLILSYQFETHLESLETFLTFPFELHFPPDKSFPDAPLFQFISRWKRNGHSIRYKHSQG